MDLTQIKDLNTKLVTNMYKLQIKIIVWGVGFFIVICLLVMIIHGSISISEQHKKIKEGICTGKVVPNPSCDKDMEECQTKIELDSDCPNYDIDNYIFIDNDYLNGSYEVDDKVQLYTVNNKTTVTKPEITYTVFIAWGITILVLIFMTLISIGISNFQRIFYIWVNKTIIPNKTDKKLF